MHGTEPTQPHQLRNPARIGPICLHRHRLEGVTDVAGLQQSGPGLAEEALFTGEAWFGPIEAGLRVGSTG
jgi:hypothetical protein